MQAMNVIEEEKQGHVPYTGESDDVAKDWWKSTFSKAPSLEDFVPQLLQQFLDDKLSGEDKKRAEYGTRDYFSNTFFLSNLNIFFQLTA